VNLCPRYLDPWPVGSKLQFLTGPLDEALRPAARAEMAGKRGRRRENTPIPQGRAESLETSEVVAASLAVAENPKSHLTRKERKPSAAGGEGLRWRGATPRPPLPPSRAPPARPPPPGLVSLPRHPCPLVAASHS